METIPRRGRNPASQIRTETQSNDAYSWDGHVDLTRTYTTNGLNQYESAGSASFCYDANGNLTADGSSVYKYDIENRLVEKRAQTNTACASLSYAGTLQAELRYDTMGRLYYVRDYAGSSGITRFAYDGNAMVAEYNNSGTMLRRYVHGSNAEADDPLLWYEGTSTASSNARHLYADPRGSIALVAGASGNTIAINTYDAYGIPGSANTGRFQYTGQMWIEALGMYYYKARIYSPTLGRFLQTDPIGYEDQVNLYAYVYNDPVNNVDPSGKCGPLSPVCAAAARCAANNQCRQSTLAGARTAIQAARWCANNAGACARIIEGVARAALESASDVSVTIGPEVFNNESVDPPEDIVGENPKPTKGRVNSDGLAPENGGTGDAEEDFETLTGGNHRPAQDGDPAPPGSQIGDNGVVLRPGPNGPRIDIPPSPNGKPRETLHYPPR